MVGLGSRRRPAKTVRHIALFPHGFHTSNWRTQEAPWGFAQSRISDNRPAVYTRSLPLEGAPCPVYSTVDVIVLTHANDATCSLSRARRQIPTRPPLPSPLSSAPNQARNVLYLRQRPRPRSRQIHTRRRTSPKFRPSALGAAARPSRRELHQMSSHGLLYNGEGVRGL